MSTPQVGRVPIRCPLCGELSPMRVRDTRTVGEGQSIRRRRQCSACGGRFTTYERIELDPKATRAAIWGAAERFEQEIRDALKINT